MEAKMERGWERMGEVMVGLSGKGRENVRYFFCLRFRAWILDPEVRWWGRGVELFS